jgi:hypothetical protein
MDGQFKWHGNELGRVLVACAPGWRPVTENVSTVGARTGLAVHLLDAAGYDR